MNKVDNFKRIHIVRPVEFGKFELILFPCPFCGKIPTPHFNIETESTDKTWGWYLQCDEKSCGANPRTKSISIRKTTKKDQSRLIIKVKEIQDRWNTRVMEMRPFKLLVDHYMLRETEIDEENI